MTSSSEVTDDPVPVLNPNFHLRFTSIPALAAAEISMDAAFSTPLNVRPFLVAPASAVTEICGRTCSVRHAVSAPSRPAATNITMKRNRFHAPKRPQRPGAEEVKLPEDGTPVFAIFVRSTTAKIWYPLGSVKGDDRSKQLVGALKNGLGRAIYANVSSSSSFSRTSHHSLRTRDVVSNSSAETRLLTKALRRQFTDRVDRGSRALLFACTRS